jgi:hypothetical protein
LHRVDHLSIHRRELRDDGIGVLNQLDECFGSFALPINDLCDRMDFSISRFAKV